MNRAPGVDTAPAPATASASSTVAPLAIAAVAARDNRRVLLASRVVHAATFAIAGQAIIA